MIKEVKEHRKKTLLFADVMKPDLTKNPVRSVVIDMGSDGLEFECAEGKFTQGEEVEIMFSNSQKKDILILEGRIRRIREHENGTLCYDVEFDNNHNFIDRIKMHFLIKEVGKFKVHEHDIPSNKRHPKVETLCEAKIKSVNEPSKNFIGEVVDLNMSGLILKCEKQKFGIGKEIKVDFEPCNVKNFIFTGKIKRVHKISDGTFGYGIHFDKINLIDKVKIFILKHKIRK
ncbi:MAG: PilZ domain-containing protein [Elusimicrobiota bacterium]